MKILRVVFAAVLFVAADLAGVDAQQANTATDAQAASAIRQLIGTYMQAVDAADPAMAAKVFLTTRMLRSSTRRGTSAGGSRLPMRCS
jgi:hypothetical protein